jgi:hypothetical protein
MKPLLLGSGKTIHHFIQVLAFASGEIVQADHFLIARKQLFHQA